MYCIKMTGKQCQSSAHHDILLADCIKLKPQGSYTCSKHIIVLSETLSKVVF